MQLFKQISLTLMLMGILTSPVQAVLVSTDFNGTVTLDNAGNNPFGLLTGDSISGSAIYDDALIVGTSPDEEHAINALSGWSFSITLGSFTFTETDVTDPTYTTFWFNMGAFDGIEFFIEPINIGVFSNLLVEDFDGGRSLFVEDLTGNPVYLEADWDFANASTPVPVAAAVPEPATLALLGMGLIGLGFRKKMRS